MNIPETDRDLAKALTAAEEAGDIDAMIDAENAIIARLELPLDWTEQGINDKANEAIQLFLIQNGELTVESEADALRHEARQEALLDAGPILSEYRSLKGE